MTTNVYSLTQERRHAEEKARGDRTREALFDGLLLNGRLIEALSVLRAGRFVSSETIEQLANDACEWFETADSILETDPRYTAEGGGPR